MKAFLLCFMLIFSFSWAVSAQENLVLNPSLEDVVNDACLVALPDMQRMVRQWVPPWTGPFFGNFCPPNATLPNPNCMDLANIVQDCGDPLTCLLCVNCTNCNSGHPLIPAIHGKVYSIMVSRFLDRNRPILYGRNGLFWGVFLSGKLKRPLKAGFRYSFSYYVYPTLNTVIDFNCYDVFFSKDSLHFPHVVKTQNGATGLFADIYSSVTNTGYDLANQTHPAQIRYTGQPLARGQWYRISGDFIADGGEQFLALGCLRDSANYLIAHNGGSLSQNAHYNNVSYDSITLREWVNQRANEQRVPTFVTATPVNPIDTTNPPPPPPPFEIPNVITPNGDGLNDYWVIDGLPEGSAVVLHNRWGNTVFSEAPYRHRFNAEGLEAGNYFYLITEPNGTFHKGPLRVIKE